MTPSAPGRMGSSAMAANNEEPDRLTVRRDAETEYHFHYNREERLKMKGELPEPERKRRRRVKKYTQWLYVLLGAAIMLLIMILLYKIFF